MTRQLLPIYLLIALLLTTACESVLVPNAPANTNSEPIRVTQVTSVQPGDVLRDFITAWNTEDYETMYRLIASPSRNVYPRQVFENRYTVAHSAIRFDGVEHTLNEVVFQGETAILDYNVGIKSPTFGVIEDNNR